MRSVLATILLAAFTLAPVSAGQERSAAERSAQREQVIRRFDKDGDGKLNEEETRALREFRRARQAGGSRPASGPAELTLPSGVRRMADVEYAKTPEDNLLLDIYLPDTKGKPLPVILWVHGGAWVSGNKTHCPIVSFAGRGYAIVSINYRLTGKARFPAQIHDCKAAVRWVRAHAAEYGFDPGRVGACGGSAGGHLVALLGTSGGIKALEGEVGGNLQYPSTVQAVCDFCGPTDFTREDYVRDKPTTQPAVLERALIALLGGPWDDNREAARMASPIDHISKDDPPFLIAHGDADPIIPIKHSRLFHEKLQEAGIDATLRILPGGGHAVGTPDTLEAARAFFDKHLKKRSRTEP